MNIIRDTSVMKFGLATMTLIFAIVMFVLITPFAWVFNLIYSVYKRNIKGFVNYWKGLFYQVWIVIYNLKFFIALSIDYFGNAFCGELLKFAILKDKTKWNLFGDGKITISAAIGQAIFAENITNTGLNISFILDILFNEENHCLNAYSKWFEQSGI
jgi:hypothetical protein